MNDAPVLARSRLEIDGPLATLTLADVQRGNAMGFDLFEEVIDAVRWLSDQDELRAVLITGEDDTFCVGGDMHTWYAERSATDNPWRHGRRQAAKGVRLLVELLTTIRQLPCITAAAINGVTIGAGVGLALACDLRVAAPRARMLFGYSRIGVTPDGGVTWLLPRIVGEAAALELLLDDRPLKAARLQELGLVHRVAEEDVVAETREWLTRLARRAAPAYVRGVKHLVTQAPTASYAQQLFAERELMVQAIATPDADAGLAAFAEGEPQPEFRGWLAPAVPSGTAS